MPLSDHEQPTRPISLLTPDTRTVRSPRSKLPWLLAAATVLVVLIGGTWLATRPATSDPATGSVSPPSPLSAPTASPASTEYTVAAGDTMKIIAQKVYGDPEAWPQIYEANRELIGPNPDTLTVGTRLRIPPL